MSSFSFIVWHKFYSSCKRNIYSFWTGCVLKENMHWGREGKLGINIYIFQNWMQSQLVSIVHLGGLCGAALGWWLRHHDVADGEDSPGLDDAAWRLREVLTLFSSQLPFISGIERPCAVTEIQRCCILKCNQPTLGLRRQGLKTGKRTKGGFEPEDVKTPGVRRPVAFPATLHTWFYLTLPPSPKRTFYRKRR